VASRIFMHTPLILPEGPSLCITLAFEDLQLKRTTLDFADKFTCKIEGKGDPKLIQQLLGFLEGYGKKRPGWLELPLSAVTPFRREVLTELQRVPFGEKLTYGELAAKSGNSRAARAVGSACHYNPFPLFIPCHRVVASGGALGGFAYGPVMKKLLLDFES
jgi:O-6-methylguanine DNA methyltransferase